LTHATFGDVELSANTLELLTEENFDVDLFVEEGFVLTFSSSSALLFASR
jgi:hypothetical protein